MRSPSKHLLPAALLFAALGAACGSQTNAAPVTTSASLSLEQIDGVNKYQAQQAARQVPKGLPLDGHQQLYIHGLAAGFNPDSSCEPFAVVVNDSGQTLPALVIDWAFVDPATGERKQSQAGALIRPLAPGTGKLLAMTQLASGCTATQLVIERVRCRDEQAAPIICPFTRVETRMHGLDPQSPAAPSPSAP